MKTRPLRSCFSFSGGHFLVSGAKGKYRDWITEYGLTLIQGWAREGLTDADIAKNIGINKGTMCEWKNRFPEFAEALKITRDYADFLVENALFKKAISGDTTAMIFWLKNRKPRQWRDHPEAPTVTDDALLMYLEGFKNADVIEKP